MAMQVLLPFILGAVVLVAAARPRRSVWEPPAGREKSGWHLWHSRSRDDVQTCFLYNVRAWRRSSVGQSTRLIPAASGVRVSPPPPFDSPDHVGLAHGLRPLDFGESRGTRGKGDGRRLFCLR